jgi:hypothetical protein
MPIIDIELVFAADTAFEEAPGRVWVRVRTLAADHCAVHVPFQPVARGRIAFGGGLVE